MRVTKSPHAARPARHHVGEKAGAIKSFDGFVVQEGDRFVDAVVASHSASQAILNAALEVAACASLQFGADLKQADRFVRTWQDYVLAHADFARVTGEDKSLTANLSRAARVIKALVAGDVLPEELPTERGLRAASEACPKRTTAGRKATEDTNAAEAEAPQSREDAALMAALAALASKIKTAPDGYSLVQLMKTAPMACVAALRGLRDSVEADAAPTVEPAQAATA